MRHHHYNVAPRLKEALEKAKCKQRLTRGNKAETTCVLYAPAICYERQKCCQKLHQDIEKSVKIDQDGGATHVCACTFLGETMGEKLHVGLRMYNDAIEVD